MRPGNPVFDTDYQLITTPYVAVGSITFEIANATSFKVGDVIAVTRTPNEAWIFATGMDQETLCADATSTCNGWSPASYTENHERVITAIDGNRITIDIPIVDVMEEAYGALLSVIHCNFL